MVELNGHDARLLQVGFLLLRQAFDAGDREWLFAEIEFLHNVPSLLGEENIERQRYFWFSERDIYLERLEARGEEEPLLRMRIFYEPIWKEMEPVMLRILNSAE
jgi:hypothetical protein